MSALTNRCLPLNVTGRVVSVPGSLPVSIEAKPSRRRTAKPVEHGSLAAFFPRPET